MTELLNEFLSVIAELAPWVFLIALLSAGFRARRATPGFALVGGAVDAALAYAALAVLFLVFSPQPQSPSIVELQPGDDLLLALEAAPGDVLPWMQLAGNFALLLPLCTLLPLRMQRLNTVARIVLTGFVLSCTIELVQYLFITGRTSSTDDVMLNTTGAALGGVIYKLLSRPGSPFAPGSRYRPRHERMGQRHTPIRVVVPANSHANYRGPRHARERVVVSATRPHAAHPRIYRQGAVQRV